MTMKMKDADLQKIIETSWRRPLTAEEKSHLARILAERPERRPSWEEDARLSRLLRSLPAAPVSSNFTARVLQAASSEAAPRATGFFGWLPAGWLPRAALAMAMAGCGLLSFHEYQAIQRADVAREVARASQLASVPSVGWLEDFDTINRLNKVRVADDDLLTTLE